MKKFYITLHQFVALEKTFTIEAEDTAQACAAALIDHPELDIMRASVVGSFHTTISHQSEAPDDT